MKTFYKTLLKEFETNKSKFTEKGLQPIKIIDLYNSQDINPEYSDLLTLPALFVNMQIDYNVKPPILSLDFKLIYKQLRNTSNISLSRKTALNFFDLADTTDQIIKNISTDHTGTLRLLNEGFDLEPTVSDVYNLTYQCEYYGKKNTRKRFSLSGDIDDVKIKTGLFTKLL